MVEKFILKYPKYLNCIFEMHLQQEEAWAVLVIPGGFNSALSEEEQQLHLEKQTAYPK